MHLVQGHLCHYTRNYFQQRIKISFIKVKLLYPKRAIV
jgi:hypothetical protein